MENETKKTEREKPIYAKINKFVLILAAAVCFAFYGPMIIFQSSLQGLVSQLMHFITYTTDFIWEFAVVGCLLFSLWLALSKYGNIKLGGPGDKPEFSTFTWFAMLFCGGSGAGLLYWGVLEPVYYLNFPPFWAEPLSPQAAQYGEAYGIFHWGIMAWAMFVIPAIGFGYMAYVKKRPYMYPSYACRDVIGVKRAEGIVGRIIDVLVVIGMIGGVGTTLATFLPMMCDLAANYLGIERNIGIDLGFVLAFTCLFGYSCYKGLYSGISKISNINMYFIFILLIALFLLGPTSFLLSMYTDSIGTLFSNFIRMSLYTDPISKSGFPQDWTVFYWAWWFAWAIYMGLFVARISRGRTIRSIVLNMLLTTTLGCSIYYMMFGGFAIDLMMNQGVNLLDILNNMGDVACITYVINAMPLAKVIVPLLVVVMLISQVTAVDSLSYSIAQMCCDKIEGRAEPPRWSRIFWCVMIFICVCGLILVGGNQAVKLSSLMTSFPVIIIELIMAITIVKWLKSDFQLPDDTPKFIGKIDVEENTTTTTE